MKLRIPTLLTGSRYTGSRTLYLAFIKSIRLDMGPDTARYLEPIANSFCVGFLEHCRRYTTVHLFMKKDLVDAALSPDETERREIRVEGENVSMNTTCLLACGPDRHNLEKNDFWMSKMGLAYRPL